MCKPASPFRALASLEAIGRFSSRIRFGLPANTLSHLGWIFPSGFLFLIWVYFFRSGFIFFLSVFIFSHLGSFFNLGPFLPIWVHFSHVSPFSHLTHSPMWAVPMWFRFSQLWRTPFISYFNFFFILRYVSKGLFNFFWAWKNFFLKIWDFLGFWDIPGNPGIFSKIPGWGSQGLSWKSHGISISRDWDFFSWDGISQQSATSAYKNE